MSKLSCVLHHEDVVLDNVRLQVQKATSQIVLKMRHHVLAMSAELGGVLHACILQVCHAIHHVASCYYVSVTHTMCVDKDLVDQC